ncbi:protein kinase [Trypanosoma theileri]|uniref:Protein kinase n=1 Tax=Trypanosoma theileri TaxID=67003 RepID=A0A1X0NR61_9TRYP|nr:protein kinase [Trypanosoma theileri]ORC87205.1 protein kinase [Trypanosoma theileri]
MSSSKGEHLKVREGDLIDLRFKVVHEVGCGNFSKVYSCYDVTRPRCEKRELVAVKIIKKEYKEDAYFEKQMLEILRSKDKGNKCVCRMMEFFEWKRCPVFVMSIHGPSLRSRRLGYSGGVVTRTKLVQLARSLLETFRFIHFDCRMVHTDVKPENILIADVDTPKHSIGNNWVVCDFGSASLWRMDRLDADLISTRPYRAPEVILGNPWFYAADMWSIGCILFELATGQRLFEVRDDLTHLYLMEKRLGPLPDIFKKKSKESAKFFSSQGEFLRESDLIRTGKVCMKKISDVLHDDEDLCDLISCMLIFDPFKRITAKEALKHHIFSDINNGQSETLGGVVKSTNKNVITAGDSNISKPIKTEDIVKYHWMRPYDDIQYGVNKKVPMRGSSAPATYNPSSAVVNAQLAKREVMKNIAGESQILLPVSIPPPPPPPPATTTTSTTTTSATTMKEEKEKQKEEVKSPLQLLPQQEKPQEQEEVKKSVVEDTVIPSSPKRVALPLSASLRSRDNSSSPHRSERFCKMRGLPIGQTKMDQPSQTGVNTNNKREVTNPQTSSLLTSIKPMKSDVTEDVSSGMDSATITENNKCFSPISLGEDKSPPRERLQPLLAVTEARTHPARDSADDCLTNEGTSADTGNGETDVGSPLPPSVEETDGMILTLPVVQQKPSESVGTVNGNSFAAPLSGLYTQTPALTHVISSLEKSESLPSATCSTTIQSRRTKSTPPPNLLSWSEPGVQESITPKKTIPTPPVIPKDTEKISNVPISDFPGKSYNNNNNTNNNNISSSSGTSAITVSMTSVSTSNKNSNGSGPVQGTITRRSIPNPPPSLALRKFAQQLRPGIINSVANMNQRGTSQSASKRTDTVGKFRQRSGTHVITPGVPPVVDVGRSHRANSLCIPLYQQGLPKENTSTGISASAVAGNRIHFPQVPNMFASKSPTVPVPPPRQFSSFVSGKAVQGAQAPQVQQTLANSRVVKRQVIQKTALPPNSSGVVVKTKTIDPQEKTEKTMSSSQNTREKTLVVGGGGEGGVEGRKENNNNNNNNINNNINNIGGGGGSNKEASPRGKNDKPYTKESAGSTSDNQLQLHGPYNVRRLPNVQAPE